MSKTSPCLRAVPDMKCAENLRFQISESLCAALLGDEGKCKDLFNRPIIRRMTDRDQAGPANAAALKWACEPPHLCESSHDVRLCNQHVMPGLTIVLMLRKLSTLRLMSSALHTRTRCCSGVLCGTLPPLTHPLMQHLKRLLVGLLATDSEATGKISVGATPNQMNSHLQLAR